MARRDYGTGSVHEIAPGRWKVQVCNGIDPITGRRRRISKTIRATSRAAAEAALEQLRASVVRGDRELVELLRDFLATRLELADGDRAAFKQLIIDKVRACLTPPTIEAPTITTSMPTTTGWVVYRAYDAQGSVLYVGMTGDLWGRMGAWRREATWWPTAHRIDWTYCETKDAAATLERAEIRRLSPPHNVQYRIDRVVA